MVAKRATVMCFSELRSKFDGAAEAFLRIVSAVLRHLDIAAHKPILRNIRPQLRRALYCIRCFG